MVLVAEVAVTRAGIPSLCSDPKTCVVVCAKNLVRVSIYARSVLVYKLRNQKQTDSQNHQAHRHTKKHFILIILDGEVSCFILNGLVEAVDSR